MLMAEKQRILIVDDQALFLRMISKILDDCGYDITEASNAFEALEFYLQRHFPLVITDVEMPGMSGIELVKTIKQINDNTEIVVMNSYASLDIALTAMRAGAYDYLIKPFRDIEAICNTAHRALEKVKLKKQNQNLIEALKQHNKALETANARLRQLAIHDGLTGLFNHRYLQERLVAELDRAHRYPEPFSILFIDVDYFKIYNDSNGHLKGDQLLKRLSALFLHSFRKTDVVSRYGGDEFVVILPETKKQQAQHLAFNLKLRVKNYSFSSSESMPAGCVTVSIGCVTYPEDGTEASALLHRADQLLYADKKNRIGSKDHIQTAPGPQQAEAIP
jgi:diguanylate cyclase (GGDEF)-like protein